MENKIEELEKQKMQYELQIMELKSKIHKINIDIKYGDLKFQSISLISFIINSICDYFGLDNDLRLWGQGGNYISARYIISYILRNKLGYWYQFIAYQIWKTSHATVIYSLKNTKLNAQDKIFLDYLLETLWDYNNQKTMI